MKILWSWHLLLLLLMTGCAGEWFDTNRISSDIKFESGLMIPLAHADVSVKDILAGNFDEVVYYKDANGDERVKICQSRDSVEAIGLNQLVSTNIPSVSFPIPLTAFNLGTVSRQTAVDVQIEHFSVSTVQLGFVVEVEYTNIPKPVNLNISFPSMLRNTEGVQAVMVNSGIHSFSFDKSMLMFPNGQLPIDISLSRVSASDLFPHIGEGNIEMRFKNVELISLSGSTNGFSISSDTYTDKIDLSTFKHFDNQVRFDNPSVQFFVTNQTMLQGLVMPKLMATKENGTSLGLISNSIAMNPSTGTGAVRAVTIMDKGNSNIRSFFDFLPDGLQCRGDFNLSMPTNRSEIIINNNDTIYLGYRVELPLEMTVDATVEIDTVDIDNTNLFEKINRATFIVDSENSMPLEASLSIAFYDDETKSIIDRVECPNLIPAGKVSRISGKVTEAAIGNERIELTAENIKNLRRTEKLILQLQIKSVRHESNQVVVLLAKNNIRLNVSIAGDFTF